MTRGALTTFSVANDTAKYFAIIPVLFFSIYPQLAVLNFMSLTNSTSSRMDKEDGTETDTRPLTSEQVKEAVRKLMERKEQYQAYLKELIESGETQLLLTDPDARRMHGKDGFHCCYNVQTAVDGGSHLIAEYRVSNHNTDQGLLKQIADSAKGILETETLEVTADKGYDSRKDILDRVMNGIVPDVAIEIGVHNYLNTQTFKNRY